MYGPFIVSFSIMIKEDKLSSEMRMNMDLRLDYEDRDKARKDKIKEILIWAAYIVGAILYGRYNARFGKEP